MDTTKTCTICGKELPATLEHFVPQKSGKFGLTSTCRPCRREKSKDGHRKKPLGRIESCLRFKYGITLVEYNQMFEAQEGKCRICGKHQLELKRRLAVDHNHETGKIRGLLCHHCNVMLGHAYENPAILRTALEYLEETNG